MILEVTIDDVTFLIPQSDRQKTLRRLFKKFRDGYGEQLVVKYDGKEICRSSRDYMPSECKSFYFRDFLRAR